MEKVEASVSTEDHLTSMAEPFAIVELTDGVRTVYAEAHATSAAMVERNCIILLV